MNYYKTEDGGLVRTNTEKMDMIKISKEEWDGLLEKANAETIKKNEETMKLSKPIIEYEKQIQAKIREMAINELDKELIK